MSNEERQAYQKIINYIKNNLENPNFINMLRQNGYKIIPCKLSFIIENLEKAGYTVTKKTSEPVIEQTNTPVISQFNSQELTQFIKERSLNIYTLIKDCEFYVQQNALNVVFAKQAFFKYKQCAEFNNMNQFNKLVSMFFNAPYSINLSIKN